MNARRRIITAFSAVFLAASLTACSAIGVSQDHVGGDSIGAQEPATGTADQSVDGGSNGSFTGEPETAGRSVIRSGEIALNVDDPAAGATAVRTIAIDLGGYVESDAVDSGERVPGDVTSAYIVLRVPADRLTEALTQLSELGDVLSLQQSASDVTAEHVDLQARVKALEASIERLTKLMQGAATTSDLIEAETALSQRQQELDGLRAQLTALEGQVAQASLGVSLTAASALPGGPSNFGDGFLAGWNSIVATGAGALVVLGILLPWLALGALIALAVVLIVRAVRRSRRRRASLVGDEDRRIPVEALATEERPGSGSQPPQPHQEDTQQN